ncbi:hypothetical protein DL93DRAFT_1207507 [Clavulina sp. PMI_390]|nr:hypothetical protein DL93DRAFT_1207507 [Clavulina sp. PMI_390]
MERLPIELVGEIFVLSIDSFTAFDFRGAVRFRLGVSAVNANWRAIALSTPRLWSSITVIPFPRAKTGAMEQIALWLAPIQAQIRRSANAPLSIRVYTLPSPQSARRALLDTILPCLSRCCHLEIQESYYTLEEMFPLQEPCPLLHELHIHPIHQEEGEQAHFPSLLFPSLPSAQASPSPSLPLWAPLTRLILTDVYQSSFLSSIPSSNLLDVTLRLPSDPNIITWKSLVNFFTPCADILQRLSIEGTMPTLASGDTPLIFGRLHWLTTDCITFPRYVVAPLLDRLTCIDHACRFINDDVGPEWRNVPESISIKKLELHCSYFAPPEFVDWVPSSLLAQITELSVFNFGSEIIPLLKRMAFEAPVEELFSGVRLLKLDASSSFFYLDPGPELVPTIVKLVQARPFLKLSVSEGILPTETETQIPAHVLDRIHRIPSC